MTKTAESDKPTQATVKPLPKAIEEAPEKPALPEGFGTDTCDGEAVHFKGESLGPCGMRAWVWVTMPSRKPLTFCGHHANKYMPSLAAQGARVIDLTHMISEY